MLVLGGGRRWQSGQFSKQKSHSDSSLWLFQPTSSRLSHISSIKAEQLFRERAFVLSSGDYRISHRSQQSVFKCSLKKNTCLRHHLPFETASLPSSFSCKTLPQPLHCMCKDKMMPKFIPQKGPLPRFHTSHCIEKRTLHKHARKLVTYLGPLLPLLRSAVRAGRHKAANSIWRKPTEIKSSLPCCFHSFMT